MDYLSRYDLGEKSPALDAIRRAYRFQRKFQNLSTEEIRDHQFKAIKQLVRHASASVPMYKNLYGRIVDIKSWEEFFALPELNRDAILNVSLDDRASTQLTPDTVPKSFVETSGTTGEPIVMTRSIRTEVWRAACRLIEYEWMDLVPGGNCFSNRFTFKPDAKGYVDGEDIILKDCWEEGSLSRMINFGKGIQATPGEKGPRIGELLQKLQPQILYMGPTSLGEAIPYLGGYKAQSIISIGEKLYDAARTRIEDSYGARVMNLYGANEMGRIAASCLEGDGFHVHDANVLMEIVDDNSMPVAEGETGHVLLTSLQNPGMPMIRYRVGDFVTRTYKKCSCGKGLSRFVRFDGRESAKIYLSGGRAKWAGRIADYIESISMSAHYRIYQKGYFEFVFECTKKMNLTDEQTAQIERMLAECAEQPIAFRVEFVDIIPPLPSGKRNWFLKEFVEN